MNQSVARKVRNVSLSAVVREELVRLIVEGVLKPGDRLNEVHLAEQMGVSRGPLREAARELEGQGLTVSRPRQGFFVADMTVNEIRDLYEIATWIDRAVIEDVLTYWDKSAIGRILAAIDRITVSDHKEFADTLFGLRREIVATLHNRYLADQALFLYRKFYLITTLVATADTPERMGRIIEAQRRLWTALAMGYRSDAEQIAQQESTFWREDLMPRFARG